MKRNEYLKVIRLLSDMKLDTCINDVIGGRENLVKYKRVVWGAGVSGKSFIDAHSDLGVSYIVDTRVELQDHTFMGIPIVAPNILMNENKDNTVIFLSTVIHQEISKKLEEAGFQNIIVVNQVNTSGVGLNINRSDIEDFFIWMNKNEIKYVFLKCLPKDFKKQKDIDLLIDTDEVYKLLNCPNLKSKPEKDTIYIDLSWSAPIGLNSELPLYPKSTADMFLHDDNVTYLRGIRALSDENLLYSYILHTLVHKGTNEALKKYSRIIKELQERTGRRFELTLPGLWGHLSATNCLPKLDFIRKWADYNNSYFLIQNTEHRSNTRDSITVFVFREYLQARPVTFRAVRDLIFSSGFEELRFEVLSPVSKKSIYELVRGGVWQDSYQSKIGGGPFAVGVYKTNGVSVRPLKEKIRNFVNEYCGEEVNSVHSSDDDREANEYLDILNSINSETFYS
ncbi:hypothetical protein HKCCD6035_02350 [Rhodobacterales bacterium HKCCD6035]|nr:hypothetical protein [Rhodobacterales bacterium HKCCD6035]